VLVVEAAGLPFALPLDAVEQTFALRLATRRGLAGGREIVLYRDRTLELHTLSTLLGLPDGNETAGVVIWAGGRRRVFAVDRLVGQTVVALTALPDAAADRFAVGVFLDGERIVPVLDPGACCGAFARGGDRFEFDAMQRSALAEVANIGSGHAATALAQLLGKTVDIAHTDALLTTLAQAADRLGAAAATSAVVDTPVAEGGRILMLFPDDSADQLCALLGTTVDDELGKSALREVGNILGTSYLNAIVEMTGLPLQPEPPEIEIDLLGLVVERRLTGHADLSDPAILMRSQLTIEASSARFTFLFVPQLGAVEQLLAALGL
jgi:chemotaxis protein CheC